jgi:hypothetical protein
MCISFSVNNPPTTSNLSFILKANHPLALQVLTHHGRNLAIEMQVGLEVGEPHRLAGPPTGRHGRSLPKLLPIRKTPNDSWEPQPTKNMLDFDDSTVLALSQSPLIGFIFKITSNVMSLVLIDPNFI